jgi:hypothetical protein
MPSCQIESSGKEADLGASSKKSGTTRILAYIRSNRFTLFAIYRIVFGAVLLGISAAV